MRVASENPTHLLTPEEVHPPPFGRDIMYCVTKKSDEGHPLPHTKEKSSA